MKRALAVLLVALLGLAMMSAPALAQGKGKGNPTPATSPPASGKGNSPLYPPGQTTCDTFDEHGGCPALGKGKARGTSENPATGSTSVAAGDDYTASGSGFKPNSKVNATMYSDPVDLGTITADESGAFSTTLLIPESAEPGAHTLSFTGTGPDGQPHEQQFPLVVTSPSLLGVQSATGRVTIGAALVIFLVVGAAAALVVRNRRLAVEGM